MTSKPPPPSKPSRRPRRPLVLFPFIFLQRLDLKRSLQALTVSRLPEVYKNSWALLFGFLMLMMGNGVQGSLIAIRAGQENFSEITSGFVIAGYYIGMLFAGMLTQRFVERTGHVRVFGALASVASAAILLFFVWVEPLSWFFLRVIIGFCYTGLYIVAESWLNESVSNEFRGRLFASYWFVHYLGFSIGQLLLNVAPIESADLFILVSVLLSSAIVPMMLSIRSSPRIPDRFSIGVRALYKISPFGTIAIPLISGTHTAFFAMGGYFGFKAGLSIGEISIMLFALIVGGAIFQVPVSYISDKIDRRLVIVYIAIFVTLVSTLSFFLFDPQTPLITTSLFALAGAVSLPIYGNCVAHINDLAPKGQAVAVSGRIYWLSALGCMVAPLLTAICLNIGGTAGFFFFTACAHLTISLYSVYRLFVRGAQLHEGSGLLPFISARIGVAISQQGSYSRFIEQRRSKKQARQLQKEQKAKKSSDANNASDANNSKV